MSVQRNTYLFIGDSVTETGRLSDPEGLGFGYVRIVADELALQGIDATVLNRGVGGNRLIDLAARWQSDCLELSPNLVTIAIGVNDTLRRYDSHDSTPAADFEAGYRSLLESLRVREADVVIMEPFLLPSSPEQLAWREDLEPKIKAIHRLAKDFGATLVQSDRALNTKRSDPDDCALVPDGVHPSAAGHRLLASLWLGEVIRRPDRSSRLASGNPASPVRGVASVAQTPV